MSELRCNFCNKTDDEAMCLIAAEGDVFICDECIELARDIVGVYRSKGNKIARLIFSENKPQTDNEQGSE